MENATQMHGGIKYYYPFYFIFYICKTPALSFLHFFWGDASFPFFFRNQRLNGVWYTQRKLQLTTKAYAILTCSISELIVSSVPIWEYTLHHTL